MDNKVKALTFHGRGIVDCIVSPVTLKDPFSSNSADTLGIWDTGATNSVITKDVAKDLGLKPVGMTKVRGVHGIKDVNIYYVNITLNNRDITLNTQVTECDELSDDNKVGLLIGMNIITRGDFSITNFGGNTTMSFRVPSLQTIDYVSGLRKGGQLVKDKVPGRNDPCPCGSGKIFKHCHGKNL